MKKLIILLALFTYPLVSNPAAAQCNISDIKVRVTNINKSTCEATFDLSWTHDVLNENRFNLQQFIHVWTKADYHTPVINWGNMYNSPNLYPMAADLVNALSTIVLNNVELANPTIGNVYYPDPNYILPQQAGLSVVKVSLTEKNFERITIKNIKIILPECNDAVFLKFDIWSSIDANGRYVSCASQGLNLALNELKVYGLIYCSTPPKFQVIIQNNGKALENISYRLGLDYQPQAIWNTTDTIFFEMDSISIPAKATYTSPITDYLPYSAIYPTSTRPLIIELNIEGRPNSLVATIENSCAVVPVKLLSFSATGIKNQVILKWQTASEQNNRGFEIQRKLAGGNFQTIDFIPSSAFNGYSNVTLNYRYTDIDELLRKNLVFYRIKQIDQDGNSLYSDIKYISNNGAKQDLFIYPNPSGGLVNIILPVNIGVVDMVLKDVTGKQLKIWNGFAINHLKLTDLSPGIYLLSVKIKETGDTIQHKIIIQ